MTKPIVFFSHSGQDKMALARLKDLFVEKTGGSIEVFLSSDGESIPFGRNWVYSIQQALESAKLMIVFVTPNSLRSSWVYFESGYAYSKGIRVAPVGFLGVDLAALPPPLSLLQGFNITSEDGLNNLIALANEVLGHSHAQKFTEQEYSGICESSGILSSRAFGDYGSFVKDVIITLSTPDESLDMDSDAALNSMAESLSRDEIEHTRSDTSLELYGVTIDGKYADKAALDITMDPGIVDVTFPIVEKAIRAVRAAGIDGVNIRLEFIPTVNFLHEQHKVTGRLYGSDVKVLAVNHYVRRDIEFCLGTSNDLQSERVLTTVWITVRCSEMPTQQIRELLELLFEQGILYLGREIVLSSFY